MNQQQVRQVPIFLGRKKRSPSISDDRDHDHPPDLPPVNNSKSESSSFQFPPQPVDMQQVESPPSGRANRSQVITTKTPVSTEAPVEFTLNGQKEKFIVAQEVHVDVYIPDPLYDDYYAFNDVNSDDDELYSSSPHKKPMKNGSAMSAMLN